MSWPRMNDDLKIRLAAFDWLSTQTAIFDDVIPRDILENGFTFSGKRIPLISPQGIFKPKDMQYPLSITTSPESPYRDTYEENVLEYRYRGTDPNHRDNVGLREAYKRKLPLAYLKGIVPGKYMAIWPVFITGDDPEALTFRLMVDDPNLLQKTTELSYSVSESDAGRRAYITASVKVRVHQKSFRERVLDAYLSQCTVCKIRHRELLDAAHIIPDDHPQGEPIIANGLSLCKLHHAAFDNMFIGIKPDYTIQVRNDILDEEDGPMLIHGLKELHNQSIILPVKTIHWPDKDRLSWKFEKFLSVRE
jgi:putative restriction endonuclease